MDPIMDEEHRKYPRFCPIGLTASISIEPPLPKERFTLKGIILDMSYTGIKIKLDSPITKDIQKSMIAISLMLPESGIPVTIRGIIKYLNNSSECGFEYVKEHLDDEIDDLMFECIKRAEASVQRKVSIQS